MRRHPVVAIYRIGQDGKAMGQLRSGRLGTGTILFTYTDDGSHLSAEARIARELGLAASKMGVRIAGAARIGSK